MATIQVRDLTEEAYETIRKRARASGRSIQAYMRAEIERLAREPSEEELFVEIESHISTHGAAIDVDNLLSDLDADRR